MGGKRVFSLFSGCIGPLYSDLAVGRNFSSLPFLGALPKMRDRKTWWKSSVTPSADHSTPRYSRTSALYRTCLAPELCVRTRSKEIPQSDICTLLTHPRKSPFQSKAVLPFSGLIRVVTSLEQLLDHLAPLTFPYTALQNMIRTCER